MKSFYDEDYKYINNIRINTKNYGINKIVLTRNNSKTNKWSMQEINVDGWTEWNIPNSSPFGITCSFIRGYLCESHYEGFLGLTKNAHNLRIEF